jgi:hypothetical protein
MLPTMAPPIIQTRAAAAASLILLCSARPLRLLRHAAQLTFAEWVPAGSPAHRFEARTTRLPLPNPWTPRVVPCGEEPGAGKQPARICEGQAEWPSYSATTLGAWSIYSAGFLGSQFNILSSLARRKIAGRSWRGVVANQLSRRAVTFVVTREACSYDWSHGLTTGEDDL